MRLSNRLFRGSAVIARDLMRVARREADFYRVKPSVATLYLTYRCNSRCKTCNAWKRDQTALLKSEIGLTEWIAIVDALADAGVHTVEIFGGNVLLRKDLLIPLMEYLRSKQITIHIPTNQIGLDQEQADALARYADFIYISTDGVGDFQNTIRGQNGAAGRVEATISTLRKMRGSRSTPRLICNTTVSKYNAGNLEQLVDYALSMQFDEIHFEYVGEFSPEDIRQSVVNGVTPDPNYVKGEESVLLDRRQASILKATVAKIKEKYRTSPLTIVTINIDILSEEHMYRGTIPHGKCYVERNEITVDPSGDLVACPFINNYSMGNLLTDRLAGIWNNDRHRSFRKQQNGDQVKMCSHCILGIQRNPGIWTSLRRIYFNRIQPVIGI